MKKLIILLLLGALVLDGVAQQDTSGTMVDDLSFHCQIDGDEITFPCLWSDLEQLGWSFSNAQDSASIVLPTYSILLLEKREIKVLSPQKREAEMFFCNVSDRDVPCQESMVWGINYYSDPSQIIAYDFKLPITTLPLIRLPKQIIGGISTKDEVEAAYGPPPVLSSYHDLHLIFQYAKLRSDDTFSIVMASDSTEFVVQGTVIGFAATVGREIGRLISKAGIAISDQEARAMAEKRGLERNIIELKKDLLAESDTMILSFVKYSLAMNYYFLKDFDKAFEFMYQAALTGNSDAQFGVGFMYSEGNGVEQDYKAAVLWYERAALQGNIQAMNNLGICYHKGRGVEPNEEKTFEWWLKAATGGYESLYVVMGTIYYEGLYGVKRNYKESVVWFEKAAGAGDTTGIYNLAFMYCSGRGVKQNYDKSFELLMRSDTSQYGTKQLIAEHYYYGHGVEKNIPLSITYFTDFLNLVESEEDLEVSKSYTKAIKAAQKIIKKHKIQK